MSGIIKPRTPRLNWNNPLTKGLVFDSPFFERGGTPLEIITRNVGTFLGTTKPVWAPTLFGIGIQGGSDNTSAVGWAVSDKQTGNNLITVEVLAYATALFTNGSIVRLFYKGTNAGTQRMSFGFLGTGSANHNNSIEVQIGGTTAGVFETPASSIATGAWYHIVVTHNFSSDGNVPTIYINGVLQAVTTITTTINTAADSNTVYLTNNPVLTRGLNGYEVYGRFWNRILSGQEVRQLYSNPFCIYRPYRPTLANKLAAAFTQTLTETITYTDTLLKQLSRAFSETITYTDLLTKLRTAFVTLTDTVTHTDSLIRQAGKVLSETVTYTATLLKQLARTLTETVTSTDTLLKIPGKVFSETLTYTDSVVEKITGKTLTEILSHTDTLIRGPTKVLTEIITHTDSLLKQLAKTFLETITNSDSLLRLPGKILSETITYADSVIRQAGKLLTQTITLTDTQSIARFYGRVLTETLTLTDTLSKIYGKILSETLSLTDVLKRYLNGILVIFSDKYVTQLTSYIDKFTSRSTSYSDKNSTRNTSYSDKNSARGTSYSDKNSSRGSSYSDKYTHLP